VGLKILDLRADTMAIKLFSKASIILNAMPFHTLRSLGLTTNLGRQCIRVFKNASNGYYLELVG